MREVRVSSAANAWPLVIYPGVAFLAYASLNGDAAQNKDRMIAILHQGGFLVWGIWLLTSGLLAFLSCVTPVTVQVIRAIRHRNTGDPLPDPRWESATRLTCLRVERSTAAMIAGLAAILEYALFVQYGPHDAVTIQILAWIFGLGGLARSAQIWYEQWTIQRGTRKPPG